jgi:hypothetical protein
VAVVVALEELVAAVADLERVRDFLFLVHTQLLLVLVVLEAQALVL